MYNYYDDTDYTPTVKAGDIVRNVMSTSSFDEGEVLAIEADCVTVWWDRGGVTTTDVRNVVKYQ